MRNAIKTGLEVYVCTDSEEIMAVCSLYKVKAIITRIVKQVLNCNSSKNMGLGYVINLKDKPLIDYETNLIIAMLPILKKKRTQLLMQ